MDMRLVSLPVIALFLLTMGIVGLVLLRRGLRGRLVGSHRVCRKCDYDLFNLPEDQNVCPECGSDLSAPKAVQVGYRHRRPGMIVAGAALLVLFALTVGGIGTGIARQVDWQRMKPVAWLAREARGGGVAAWMELTRRAKAGTLSSEQAQPLVVHALAWQKDLTRVWRPAVGDFVEAARDAKMVDDIQWGTYAMQAPQLTLRWRDKARPREWLPGRIMLGPARVGTSSRFSVRIEDPLESNDPLAVPPRPGGGSGETTMNSTGGGSMSASLRLDKNAVEAAQPGKRTTEARFKAQVRENWQTVIVEWNPKLSAEWELVGKGESTVEVIPDDSLAVRGQVEAALVVEKLEVRPHPTVSGGVSLSLNLKIGALPVPVSYDVFLRGADGTEWKLSGISASGPTHYGTGGLLPAKANFNAKHVDLIFRPSPGAAESTIDITRMWNGEVVVHNVPVSWPTTQPTTGRAGGAGR